MAKMYERYIGMLKRKLQQRYAYGYEEKMAKVETGLKDVQELADVLKRIAF